MAYRNKSDVHHRKANDVVREALKGEFGKIFTTDYIYDETMTLAAIRTRSKDMIVDISKAMLSPRIEMIIVDPPLLNDSKKIFFKHFEKGISFTDATTIAAMERYKIDNIITFDSHFKGMFTVL